jgi:hypothetical protein
MRQLTYTGADGTVVDLCDERGIMIGQIKDLRSRSWEYTLDSRGVRDLHLVCRAVKASALVRGGWDRLETAHRIFDADLANGKPGRVTIDGWSQEAYISSSTPDKVSPQLVGVTYTILLLSKMWRRELPAVSFLPAGRDKPDGWLNLPSNLPVNLMGMARSASITNPGLTPMPWRMTIFGPALNPHVSIAGNNHQVNVMVPDGGYLTIDSVARTIEVTDPDGGRTNAFGLALRGSGRGGGEYVFEPLPPGESPVVWANGFGFDLVRIEERSEPPWSI